MPSESAESITDPSAYGGRVVIRPEMWRLS